MKRKIVKTFEMLDWNCDQDTQAKGIALARQINDLSVFLQPMEHGGKAVWDNCAKILAEKPDEDLEPLLESLLEWVRDINWPGAFIILNRLKNFSPELLRESLQLSIQRAIKNKDNAWLDYLSELLDNPRLPKHLSENCLTILQEHYHNWGGQPTGQ